MKSERGNEAKIEIQAILRFLLINNSRMKYLVIKKVIQNIIAF
jgi:hypothetical protein